MIAAALLAIAVAAALIGALGVWLMRDAYQKLHYITLPAGWTLLSVNTPATISLDREGRIELRFVNIRNDELAVVMEKSNIGPIRIAHAGATDFRAASLPRRNEQDGSPLSGSDW